MLCQKLAAFLALVVFASQGAMAAPSLHLRSSDDFLVTTGGAVGELLVATVPAEVGKSAIQAATGHVVPGDDHRDGATDEVLKAGGIIGESVVAAVLPPEMFNAGVKAGEHYYDSK